MCLTCSFFSCNSLSGGKYEKVKEEKINRKKKEISIGKRVFLRQSLFFPSISSLIYTDAFVR